MDPQSPLETEDLFYAAHRGIIYSVQTILQ